MKIELVPNCEIKKKFKENQTVYWLDDNSKKVWGKVFFSKKLNKLAITVGYTWIPFFRGRQYFILNQF